jgi:uncharacterized protein YwgA
MPLKSALELLIALLYANNNERIKGTTRLIKLMFLLVKEGGFSSVEKELDFESYHYGPWSAEIYLDYPKTLEEAGIIKIEEEESMEFDVDEIYSDTVELKEGKIKVFSLTEEGMKVGKNIFDKLTEEEKNKLQEIKKKWNHASLTDLLTYIYLNYFRYTEKSKIKERILSNLNVSPSLLKLVGIIPSLSLEEEKEIIKKVIERKMIE